MPAAEELQRAMCEFVGAFEIVFRYDWEYTTVMIDPDSMLPSAPFKTKGLGVTDGADAKQACFDRFHMRLSSVLSARGGAGSRRGSGRYGRTHPSGRRNWGGRPGGNGPASSS